MAIKLQCCIQFTHEKHPFWADKILFQIKGISHFFWKRQVPCFIVTGHICSIQKHGERPEGSWLGQNPSQALKAYRMLACWRKNSHSQQIKWTICDTIKGNESHVGNIQFWAFNINHLSIKNATFWSKPHLYWASGCRDMNILWSLKAMKNIKLCHLFMPVTQNQYSRHPTHSPWSCHILLLASVGSRNKKI